jgi:hypothetical protein
MLPRRALSKNLTAGVDRVGVVVRGHGPFQADQGGAGFAEGGGLLGRAGGDRRARGGVGAHAPARRLDRWAPQGPDLTRLHPSNWASVSIASRLSAAEGSVSAGLCDRSVQRPPWVELTNLNWQCQHLLCQRSIGCPNSFFSRPQFDPQ